MNQQLSGLCVLIAILLATGCQRPETSNTEEASPANSPPAVEDASQDQTAGLKLAEQHCSRCHLTPQPDDLPKDRWEFTISWMGHYFGYETLTGANRNVVLDELVPDAPTVDRAVLEEILRYYQSSAPDEPKIASELPPVAKFLTPIAGLKFLPYHRSVTCVKIDAANDRIFVGDANRNALLEFTTAGTLRAKHDCRGTQPVGVSLRDDGFLVTLIGHFLLDGDAGKVMRYQTDDSSSLDSSDGQYSLPVDDYFRIADCKVADINADGHDDLLVSGFGARHTGAFSIFWADPNRQGEHTRQDLRNNNGAVCSAATDVDRDGDLDILLLTAQGHHEFMLFRNEGVSKDDGKCRFSDELIWRNRPSFGGNRFVSADIDDDGLDEVILLSGNNMEMADAPIRPYHGVYVFTHDGDAKFRQAFFHHLPAAIDAAVADFDMDGDLDIVSASSLPDWRLEKPQSTVLLVNQGKLNFDSSTIPGTEGMQWVSLDEGDIDNDGDPDIALGMLDFVPNLSTERVNNFKAAAQLQPSVLLIENTTVE